jgi:hypothetical protein
LANAIDIVRNKKAPLVLKARRSFLRRREAYSVMRALVEEKIEELEEDLEGFGEYREILLPTLDGLKELRSSLERQRDAFVGTHDPEVGERRGAEWHKAAHFIARNVEDALRLAGHKKISKEKGGPFVSVVKGALDLAGQARAPGAVASVLRKRVPSK